MRRTLRWFLVAVLALDVAVAAGLLSGSLLPIEARTDTAPAAATVAPTEEALKLLGAELARRGEELARREAEVAELLRGEEVLRRAGLLEEPAAEAVTLAGAGSPEPAEPTAPGASVADPAPSVQEEGRARAFDNLSRAYENMDPTSAARALAELAGMDEEAALELLSGWKPRTSGAILDALTQTDPALAARLSYRIWKQSGKPSPVAASSDHPSDSIPVAANPSTEGNEAVTAQVP